MSLYEAFQGHPCEENRENNLTDREARVDTIVKERQDQTINLALDAIANFIVNNLSKYQEKKVGAAIPGQGCRELKNNCYLPESKHGRTG